MQVIDEYYTENDNTYVNISFTNPANSTATSIPLNYDVTKTAPVLADASQYYASIVKFSIPLYSLPVVICPIIPNQGNPNLTPLQVGIRRSGVNSLVSVQYISQTGLDPPSQVGSLTQVITPYYFMYTYDQLITLINTALNIAWIASGLNDPATIIGQPPYFIYDANTGLFSLIVNNSFNTAGGPQVIFNYPMFQFLDNFDVTVVGQLLGTSTIYTYLVYGLVNEHFAYNYYGIAPPAGAIPPFGGLNPPITSPYFYKITQNAVSVSGWNPITKVLFLTTNMSIHPEIIPGANASINGNNNGVFSSLSVLSEFTPQIVQPPDSRSIAYYNAQGNYGLRLADMTTNAPLYKIDVKVVWQDIANNIYPVVIEAYSQANIKLAFIKKNLYKHRI